MTLTSFHFFLYFNANYDATLVVSASLSGTAKAHWTQEVGNLNSLHPDLWQAFGTVSSKDDSQEQEEMWVEGREMRLLVQV